MASFTGLPAKVVQRILDSVHPADTLSLSLVTKSTFKLAQPYLKKRKDRQWCHRAKRFYWQDKDSSLVPITHSDNSPSDVVSRMTEFLEKVDLNPDIADYVKELWMPGPRYSCKPNERLRPFPTSVISLIETEITKCIQPQYLDCYLKDGWQDSKCLSTVLITATMIFLLSNVKTLVCSGGSTYDECSGERSQLWGAETLYKLIKRLQVHKKAECKILQKLESASIRWTRTSQMTNEFLEWLAALPTIKSIQADGISTRVMPTRNRILSPRSSSLTKLEFHGRLHGTETLEGLLEAARSFKCFVYHDSSEFENDIDRVSRNGPRVGGRELCSVLAKYSATSLEKLRTNLGLSVKSLSVFQRLTHLYAPLNTLPILGLPGEISTALALPPNLEHLILPQNGKGVIQELVVAVVNAKDLRWPNLRNLTLPYSPFAASNKAFRKSIENATNDLAEVGVEFHCLKGSQDFLSGEYMRNLSSLF